MRVFHELVDVWVLHLGRDEFRKKAVEVLAHSLNVSDDAVSSAFDRAGMRSEGKPAKRRFQCFVCEDKTYTQACQIQQHWDGRERRVKCRTYDDFYQDGVAAEWRDLKNSPA